MIIKRPDGPRAVAWKCEYCGTSIADAAEVAERVAWRCEETAYGLPDGIPATLAEHAADAAADVEAWLSGRTRGGAL